MHVLAKKKFIDASKKYQNHAKAIMDTYYVLRKSKCNTPLKLQSILPSLERFKYKNDWYVIDISGNHIRLIAMIFFKTQKVYIKHIVDHKEYDKLIQRYARE